LWVSLKEDSSKQGVLALDLIPPNLVGRKSYISKPQQKTVQDIKKEKKYNSVRALGAEKILERVPP
jgi:hypothetical protein